MDGRTKLYVKTTALFVKDILNLYILQIRNITHAVQWGGTLCVYLTCIQCMQWGEPCMHI